MNTRPVLIAILGISFFFLQACATPIKSENPLTAEQKASFYYPQELITIDYDEKAGERIEKYDAKNAEELEKDENPSGRDIAKSRPFVEVLREKIAIRLDYLNKSGTEKPMAIHVQITNFIRATAARQIFISGAENITALVSIIDPETDQEVTNYTIFFGRNKGEGLLGAALSSSSRSSTLESLTGGLADRIAEALY